MIIELDSALVGYPVRHERAARLISERGLVEYYGQSSRRLTEDGAKVFERLIRTMEVST